ncbi:hypothetical protein ACLMJK_004013 [Lecanora helva]
MAFYGASYNADDQQDSQSMRLYDAAWANCQTQSLLGGVPSGPISQASSRNIYSNQIALYPYHDANHRAVNSTSDWRSLPRLLTDGESFLPTGAIRAWEGYGNAVNYHNPWNIGGPFSSHAHVSVGNTGNFHENSNTTGVDDMAGIYSKATGWNDFAVPGPTNNFSMPSILDAQMNYYHPTVGDGSYTYYRPAEVSSSYLQDTRSLEAGNGKSIINTVEETVLENSIHSVSQNGAQASSVDAKSKQPQGKASRVVCDKCNKTFSRLYDLRRHALKHDEGAVWYYCGVKGCGYGGYYRPDKVFSHVRNCHYNGRKYFGVIQVREYVLPACGDCLFSANFLRLDVITTGTFTGIWRGGYERPLERFLNEDHTGFKTITEEELRRGS